MRFHLVLRSQDLVSVVTECAQAFEALARAHAISLRLDVPARAEATFDTDRILQVLSNLVRNAIQFTPAGGNITFSLVAQPRGCRVSVTDTGTGISPTDLPHVFERFHQAPNSDRRGLGLGLYISKAIIDAHGGRIWAESELGHGSTFSFTVPH